MKFSLAIASIVIVSIISTALAEGEAEPHFTYGPDNAGPQHWGDLDPLWAKCKTGKKQSPIDVETEKPFVTFVKEPLKHKYNVITDAVIGYNGHSVQVDWTQPENSSSTSWVEVNGKKYALVQFHFHTPSEHRVNNHFAAGEMHLVHRADDGTLAAIGVFLELRVSNDGWFNWITALDKAIDKRPAGQDPTKTKLHIKEIDLPGLSKFTNGFAGRWSYAGSLTTPPCTEGVAWNVIKKPLRLGLKQFDALVDIEGFNSRFIQGRPGKSHK
ncbi:hypothetical protein BGW42_001779 [Actinomortierella wolfii]|nr:hypothetical protein BGW42_001779 [Actinomortierella wolfii]